MAAELRHLVELESFDYLQGEQIALQDRDLRIHVRGIGVVWRTVIGILEIDEIRIGTIDGNAADRFIDRRHLEAGNGDDREDGGQNTKYGPLPLDQDP